MTDPGQPTYKKIDSRQAAAVEFVQTLRDLSDRIGQLEAWQSMALAICETCKTDDAVLDFIRMLEDCQTARNEERRPK